MAQATMEQAEALLKKYYGYHAFKPIQKKAIESILAGSDTFVVMPTGGGKSLCYQIPALVLPGVSLVISPLISLMKDQVDELNRRGVVAACLNSMTEKDTVQQIVEDLERGALKILYVAPERLLTYDFQNLMQNQAISLVAVDEAHCVSQWGHDFRPSYGGIRRFIASLPVRPVVAAFTATATEETRRDIIMQLELRQTNLYRASFNRPNLILAVKRCEDRKADLFRFVEDHRGQAGIIYCNTRKEVDKIWDYLSRKGIPVVRYHGGMEDWERNANQDSFLYEKVNLIVATNAFGMGINKPDVRFVLHYNMPKNMESYYQEIGRAGRDGQPSLCVLFFSYSDVHINRYLVEQNVLNEERKQIEMDKLEAMVSYATTDRCLRAALLSYFGEKSAFDCKACSNCVTINMGKPMLQQIEENLIRELRSYRLLQAMEEGVPSYRVFSDEVLHILAKQKPTSISALEQVEGLGEAKIASYGEAILKVIREFA